ncbi:MAG TPA: aromatic amino acid ammonia-lyase [Desulfomonilia bacterium]
MSSHFKPDVVVGNEHIGLSRLIDVADSRAQVVISGSDEFVSRMEASRSVLHKAIREGTPVYGVTTGYGASCGNRIGADDIEALGNNLITYHGCGTGEPLGIKETRAAMMCRIVSLSRGLSGVTINLLKQIAAFLNAGITPVIPSLGSVGASGDLTPLSYLAATLAGKREVVYKGKVMESARAITEAGLKPYIFEPKEPLGILNGTSIMTGIASVVLYRSKKILDAATAATALTVHALKGHADHFHKVITDSKEHPGQISIGKKLRALLSSTGEHGEISYIEHLQDPYSIRCVPQILGVVDDTLTWVEKWVVTEINSSNDNPLFDPETGAVLMGGNFYGGHIAFAMDSLKSALAQVADLLDRQLALLVDTRFNRGLPSNLVKVKDQQRFKHHGFKGMQITASALTAEALKNTMPVSSFSRSTESHNQDKVSLGTIAARDALRQCELVSSLVAVHLMASVQSCEIRGGLESRPEIKKIVSSVRNIVADASEDREMGEDIGILASALYEMVWDE